MTHRDLALACLGFWRELPNTIWNVNFTTITRVPATLNADCFVNNGFLNHVCDAGLCEEPERNRSNKRHDASTVIKTFIVLNLIKTTEV